METNVIWTVQHRTKMEKIGGCWLPVYILGESIADPTMVLRCFYCGFTDGHDFACRYLWHCEKYPQRGKKGTPDHLILVPKGGIPPSESIF